MILARRDILKHIAESLDPDDILTRLDISSEELVDILSNQIITSLDSFYDIYDPELGEEELE